MIAQLGAQSLNRCLTPQNLYQFFEFQAHLMNELLTLIEIHLRIIAGEAVSGTANRESLLIQQAAYLANDEHILALIVAAISAALDGFELWKFLLPVAQHMRFHAAQIAHFADGEVALPRDRRQLAIVAWFQHTP